MGLPAFNVARGRGHAAVVEFLLLHPMVDVNKPTYDGSTPFLVACYNGRKEVVSLLLADIGVDVNEQQNEGALLSTWPVNKATTKWYRCSWQTRESTSTLQSATNVLPFGWPPKVAASLWFN